MNKVKLLNKISPIGINQLDKAKFQVSTTYENPDAIMVRSAKMHDMKFNAELKAIARCGAGVNNIPVDECAEKGIVVFNTPGANANGVKELTIAALLLSSRKIVDGIQWANTLTEDVAKAVEAGKSDFSGCELAGKTLGIIGLGAIGGHVANAAQALGMSVIGCDPYLTVDAAWGLSSLVKKASTYEEVFKQCDYITLHIPSTKETKHIINSGSIALMRQGVKIINLARADLVCVADVKEALADGHISSYVTDFPTEETINVPGILTIPHLGASTVESEENCAIYAAKELSEFLLNGNIINSVNYPSVEMPRTDAGRMVILNKNIPNMISHISAMLAKENINIENMANRSKGEYACTIIDTYAEITPEIIAEIESMKGIIRVIIVP